MTHILRIDSSLKGEDSISRRLTGRIVARLAGAHPDARVTERDLSRGVPQIDAGWIGAVYTAPEARSADQASIADYSDRLLAEVKAADVLVIGLPVYNFGVPATLKSWIDHLARKGETFRYTQAGPEGLLKGKRAIIALSSDGTKLGSGVDFASGYVKHMLGFFGITEVEFVAADQMIFDAEGTIRAAEDRIESLAA
ncbi:NAD(P)H-dependent oxidoreductase [Defluviimonas sp. WL0002]|uniref:FMN dependent NADH:quinone oxidoreductase n=1 Tax=Albidovulum marisflavi TaxID=2984159 RepID=A0ABT2Z9H1_9RHOB|nr:NAD(P)H-dependent oxidoreductase [Defluviimonas sp. WL0002]MCV2867789.1 NAD(P)H-dependent oxidoreductase [Defluviimonas sp. WL0002]